MTSNTTNVYTNTFDIPAIIFVQCFTRSEVNIVYIGQSQNKPKIIMTRVSIEIRALDVITKSILLNIPSHILLGIICQSFSYTIRIDPAQNQGNNQLHPGSSPDEYPSL